MFDDELLHREVARIACRKVCAHTRGGRRNKAIGLAQCDPLRCEVTTPTTGRLTLSVTERRDAQPAQQPADRGFFTPAGTAPKFLDVYGADERGW